MWSNSSDNISPPQKKNIANGVYDMDVIYMANWTNYIRALHLAAVSGYSGDMLPPICLEYDFHRWPLFTNPTY